MMEAAAINGHAAPQAPPGEIPVGAVECIPVMGKEEANRNVIASRERGLLNFLQLPEVGRRKSTPVAIVAGGPSTKDHIEKIRKYRVVIAAGTVHDYLVERGIHPRYAVLFDPYARGHVNNIQCPEGSNLEYYSRLSDTCTYLISSHSEPAIFDHFKDASVAVWHAYGDADDAVFCDEGSLVGGCTAALRAITMAIVMGYWDIHFFGLDSCYFGDTSHSYQMNEPLPDRIKVKVEGAQEFDTNVAWIAQAQQFFKMLEMHASRFRPTIYGSGMIAEMYRVAQRPIPMAEPAQQGQLKQ